MKALLVLGFAIHLHHRFHGSPIGYAGLAAASAASWIGLPGPGEPVLIAAGVLAAKHKLDIASVLAVAWVSATAGGIGGWLIGLKAGRTVLTARGPLRRARTRALTRGDAIFERYAVLAIVLTPSWIAGIHRVPARLYNVTNALSAAVWAGAIGLGAYFVGPTVVELADDLGVVTTVALGVLLVLVLSAAFMRHRRQSEARAAEAGHR